MLTYPDDSYHWAPPAPSRARRPIPRSSQGHFVGQLVFGEGDGQCLGFESLLEYRFAICAIYRPDVIDVEEQIAPVAILPPGATEAVDRYLDFRVTFRSGRRFGISVKPSKIARKPTFQYEVRQIAAAAIPRLADKLAVVTEHNICRIELDNAELMHAARFAEPEIDRAIAHFAARMRGPTSVAAITDALDLRGDGLFAVCRGLSRQLLGFNRKERITGQTMVWPLPGVGQ